MVRPQVGLSEFCDTILKNWQYLNENNDVLDGESLEAFLKKIQKFQEPLEILNNKSSKSGKFYWNTFRGFDAFHFIFSSKKGRSYRTNFCANLIVVI